MSAERIRHIWPLIQLKAQRWGLDPYVLAGLVMVESAGNPWAVRYEPCWRYHDLTLSRPRGMNEDTERFGQATSWGLGQIMGTVARERGFKGWWPELCAPDVNLHYTASHLKWCLRRRGGNIPRALLRYNGGGDKDYPRRVLDWAKRLREKL